MTVSDVSDFYLIHQRPFTWKVMSSCSSHFWKNWAIRTSACCSRTYVETLVAEAIAHRA